jgi:hypothetical protein
MRHEVFLLGSQGSGESGDDAPIRLYFIFIKQHYNSDRVGLEIRATM